MCQTPGPPSWNCSCPGGQSLGTRRGGRPGDGGGCGREAASSRGGVGDLLYPAHFLVGSGHVAVDEAAKLGPGSLRLGWEVIGKFLGNHLQDDPREDLGTKEGRGSKRLGILPSAAPESLLSCVWPRGLKQEPGSFGNQTPSRHGPHPAAPPGNSHAGGEAAWPSGPQAVIGYGALGWNRVGGGWQHPSGDIP